MCMREALVTAVSSVGRRPRIRESNAREHDENARPVQVSTALGCSATVIIKSTRVFMCFPSGLFFVHLGLLTSLDLSKVLAAVHKVRAKTVPNSYERPATGLADAVSCSPAERQA